MCIEKGELANQKSRAEGPPPRRIFLSVAAKAKGTLRDAKNIFEIITLRRTWNTKRLANERTSERAGVDNKE